MPDVNMFPVNRSNRCFRLKYIVRKIKQSLDGFFFPNCEPFKITFEYFNGCPLISLFFVSFTLFCLLPQQKILQLFCHHMWKHSCASKVCEDNKTYPGGTFCRITYTVHCLPNNSTPCKTQKLMTCNINQHKCV